jgi:hypothetical protein
MFLIIRSRQINDSYNYTHCSRTQKKNIVNMTGAMARAGPDNRTGACEDLPRAHHRSTNNVVLAQTKHIGPTWQAAKQQAHQLT